MCNSKIDVAFEKISTLVKMWRVELERRDSVGYSCEYENYLKVFSIFLDENEYLYEDVLTVSEIGNPLLSYGRPLIGTPIIIDTQFDDETILDSMKKWLAENRFLNNERKRRALNQNDFDDWTYFKIREVIDLDIWAKLSGIRILDKVIASAVWSEVGDISPIDILRTTTRKKIEEVFNLEMAVRLYGQLVQSKGENFLDD